MFYRVFNSEGDTLYEGYSWPMARAALDHAIMKNDGCPALTILPDPETKKEP